MCGYSAPKGIPKPLLTTQTHYISRWMSDNTPQLRQGSLQQSQSIGSSLVPDLDPDVVITNTPGRRKWTALETADLIDGCVKVRVLKRFKA